MEKELRRLERQEIIEKVNSFAPWQSSIVPVPKKDGSVRLCNDMRPVNKAVKKDSHPVPTIEQMTARMHDARFFSTLDIKQAFLQVKISQASKYLTAFRTHLGVYQYRRLVFGLSSAAEIFQRTIESVLEGLEGVIVFIDDILVFGRTPEEHGERLRAVLKRLEEFNIRLNAEKCDLAKECVEFVGLIISAKGVKPKTEKVDQIMQWRCPKDKSEVRSLLGLIHYVGARHIKDLSTLTEPLRRLIQDDVKFAWSIDQQSAFDKIREELVNLEEIQFYSKSDRTLVYADASPVYADASSIDTIRCAK